MLPTRRELHARLFPAGMRWRALLHRPLGDAPVRLLIALALGVGGIALQLPLFDLGARLGWNAYLPWWWALPPCFGLMLLSIRMITRGAVADARRRGLACHACNTPLGGYPAFDPVGLRHAAHRIELVMTTGRCPSCGARVVRDEP